MKSVACALVFVFAVIDVVLCNEPVSTTKELPLYIRQSWVKLAEPFLTTCICESGVQPTTAFKSIMNTEVSNNPCLKCFYKCLGIKLNFMDAITGTFQEKEVIRQLEGCTSAIFKKCNEQTKNEVDLCKKSFDMYMCYVHSLLKPKAHPSPEKLSTTTPPPLTTTTNKPTQEILPPIHTIS